MDEMDACQYLRIKVWQMAQLHPVKKRKTMTIEDWIF